MDVVVYAETKEEADAKMAEMESGGKINPNESEFADSGFNVMDEETVTDDGKEILVDCVEKRFDGDILITDPFYLGEGMADEQQAESYWRYGYREYLFDKFETDNSRLFSYGLTNTLIGRTIYGDWSCTVFRKHDGLEYDIGRFCADAGLVGVFLLDEVRRFNPRFCEWLVEHRQCGTVISDFHGVVKAITTRHDPEDKEHDIPLLTHTVHLEGVGSRGNPDSEGFEFYTRQTRY